MAKKINLTPFLAFGNMTYAIAARRNFHMKMRRISKLSEYVTGALCREITTESKVLILKPLVKWVRFMLVI